MSGTTRGDEGQGPVKLAVTGASGYVARELVAPLMARGITLALITDRSDTLGPLPAGVSVHPVSEARAACEGAVALLHLAVRNNDRAGTWEEFAADNVAATARWLEVARTAGVGRFLFASSFHTLPLGGPSSFYARSKAEAEDLVRAAPGIEGHVLHLATVYGARFKGKLAAVGRLPAPVRGLALAVLGALKPILHVERLADRVAEIVREGRDGPHYLADPAARNPVYRVGKRLLDLLAMAAIVLLLGWLILLVWIAVQIDSPGPGIFAQVRLGRGETPFTCYKFRTMAEGTRQGGTHEIDRASVTRLGRRLRRTKIDELPQAANLLAGQISLVGPRPGLPGQTALREARSRAGVFAVKPGITGLAQVQSIDMSTPERLAEVDAQYIARQSLLLDLKIVLLTVRGSGQGDAIGT